MQTLYKKKEREREVLASLFGKHSSNALFPSKRVNENWVQYTIPERERHARALHTLRLSSFSILEQ